jgi:hypothetical protein
MGRKRRAISSASTGVHGRLVSTVRFISGPPPWRAARTAGSVISWSFR